VLLAIPTPSSPLCQDESVFLSPFHPRLIPDNLHPMFPIPTNLGARNQSHNPKTSQRFASCLTAIASLVAITLLTPAHGTELTCPGADECREGPPRGKLNHNSVWTSPCPPNALREGHDLICEDIADCPAAGGFGKFLRAVSGECRSKTFDGYFGLDGLTFGILDWTSDNLPAVFEIYRRRFPAKFDSVFGALQLPFSGVCLDPKWVCEKNRSGYLSCDPAFRTAFEQSVRDPELQRGQLDFAVHQFLSRVARYETLGLKTQYGVVAMAVVANNLRSTPQCKPATWMQQCKNHESEPQVVDCMLDKYVQGACRGSADGSRRRREVIQKVFRDHKSDPYTTPDLTAIEDCSSKWGQSSGAHP